MADEPKNTGGDQFRISGSVVGSAVGRGARVTAGQIIANVTQAAEQSSDADLAAEVKQALEAISKAKLPEADQAEAADTVGKIQEEMTRPEADPARPGRIRRWLTALADLCQPAADAIRAAKAVIAAITG
jgi:hypothetical protein